MKIILFLIIITTPLFGQKVSNVNYSQEQNNILITYSLDTKAPCTVSLFVSKNGGITWQGPLKKVNGDIGAKIVTGNKSITWNVLEEFDELRGEKIMFQIRTIVDDIETVLIGNQEWTTKNLNVSKYRNGDIIPEVKDPKKWANLKTGAWCYYNNKPENGKIYGKLYNWYAVNDPRGLAPEGFHVPSKVEIEKKYFSTSDLKYYECFGWLNYSDNSEYGSSGVTNEEKKNGFSVRCVRD
jgi:hypothetical protein